MVLKDIFCDQLRKRRDNNNLSSGETNENPSGVNEGSRHTGRFTYIGSDNSDNASSGGGSFMSNQGENSKTLISTGIFQNDSAIIESPTLGRKKLAKINYEEVKIAEDQEK